MTDSEIETLRLAAKAAGHEFGVIHGRPCIRVAEGWTPWNPRDDSGQALELAVKLRMNLIIYRSGAEADCDTLESTAKESGDPLAATRLAIVRAAAAMAQGEQV
jgi:hypothetical protein